MGRLKAKMLKYSIFLLAIFVTYQAVAAQGNALLKEEEISRTKYDVTGDHKEDLLIITGKRYEPDSDFFKQLTLKVESGNKTTSADLGSGYHPVLHFADFTDDGISDIFVTVETGGSGGTINAFAYSFKNGQIKNLHVPSGVPVTAQFINGYRAKIKIPGQAAVYLDVSARKAEYEKLGLYKDGVVNEATELMVDPFSSWKIIPLQNNKNGLAGIQRVSGAYHADTLVDIHSVWEYKDEKWQLIQASVKPITK